MSKSIALIPGDGIGPEVTAAGRAVIDAAMAVTGAAVEWTEFAWGSAHYREHGSMMPADGITTLSRFDAIYFGAVGDPSVPDHISVWGLILPIRRAFDQYVNLRPVRWLEGVPARLAGKQLSDIDMLFVRENVEGEYTEEGTRGTGDDGEFVEQVAHFTRRGIERAARFALEQARKRRGHLTSVTKSNALMHTMVFWDEVVGEVALDYPSVEVTRMHVDAAAYEMVVDPARFDVVLASNLFGDILTDLGAALQGSLGLAASANLNPDGTAPSSFEPVHGSAPTLAGRNVANPGGAVWAGALMLRHLGLTTEADLVMRALEDTLRAGVATPDIGGRHSTDRFADEVIRHVRERWETDPWTQVDRDVP